MTMQDTTTNASRPIHNRSKSISQLTPYSYQRSILRIASRMTMQSFLLILLIWAAPACSVGKAKDQTSGIDSSGLETQAFGDAEENWEELIVFAEVFTLIKKHYIVEKSPDQLVEGAIQGMEQWLETNMIAFTKIHVEQNQGAQDEMGQLYVFGSALTSIYRETKADPQQLVYAGIEGMVKTLDPLCNFYTQEMYKMMQEETMGGIGRLEPLR